MISMEKKLFITTDLLKLFQQHHSLPTKRNDMLLFHLHATIRVTHTFNFFSFCRYSPERFIEVKLIPTRET